MLDIKLNSEIGKLNTVIVHTPNKEIEKMTPNSLDFALFSDILNLKEMQKEHKIFKDVLSYHAKVLEVKELLKDILENENAKKELLNDILKNENIEYLSDELIKLESNQLIKILLEGVDKENKLSSFFEKNNCELYPLYNLFFTRDITQCFQDNVIISKMSKKIRTRESIIMNYIFKYKTKNKNILNLNKFKNIKLEGGDFLVISENIIAIGLGDRTNYKAIEELIENFKNQNLNIIIQELPKKPESFIHLDMVFTMLNKDEFMIYEPVILNPRYKTIHVKIENKIVKINEKENIINTLKELGINANTIKCGGENKINQEREQWHSGANFFTLAPGKIIGYIRNFNTVEELKKNGYQIIKALDFLDNPEKYIKYKKYFIGIEGNELSRGGGGCRCMTMPINRDNL